MRKSDEALQPIAAGHGGPADHRRQRAGGAADDDVLRRRALQPHRVDDDVEEDGEGEQRRRQRQLVAKPEERRPSRPRASGRRRAPRRRSRGRPASGASRVRRITASMSASYHMLSAPEAPAPTAIASSAAKPITGWMPPGAIAMPTKRGEHDQRHHARLEQREVVADAPPSDVDRRSASVVRFTAVGIGHPVVGAVSRCAVPRRQRDARQRLPLVERRRRRQRPFERRRAGAPRIVAGRPLLREGVPHAVEEDQRRRRPRCRSRSTRRSSSRRRRPDSRHSGAACRTGRGNAAGRRPG